jgi:hypothetical protein
MPRGCLIVQVERIMRRMFDDRKSVRNSQQERDLLFPVRIFRTETFTEIGWPEADFPLHKMSLQKNLIHRCDGQHCHNQR